MSNRLRSLLAFLITVIVGIGIGSALAIAHDVEEEIRKRVTHRTHLPR